MFLTGIAWGIASTTSIAGTVRLTLLFVFVHFLAISLLVATAAYFFVGRLLGPGIAGLPGRRRQHGLFTQVGDGEQLEFGYCFDVGGLSQERPFEKSGVSTNFLTRKLFGGLQVAIRAFFPVWVLLYVVQFILGPLITSDYW